MFQTLGDYLNSNYEYDVIEIIDDDGNEVTCLHDDDSRYLAEVKYVLASEIGGYAEIHIDRLYYDERGEFVTERQLYNEWLPLKAHGEIDMDFNVYRKECCSKNGTLKRVV